MNVFRASIAFSTNQAVLRAAQIRLTGALCTQITANGCYETANVSQERDNGTDYTHSYMPCHHVFSAAMGPYLLLLCYAAV